MCERKKKFHPDHRRRNIAVNKKVICHEIKIKQHSFILKLSRSHLKPEVAVQLSVRLVSTTAGSGVTRCDPSPHTHTNTHLTPCRPPPDSPLFVTVGLLTSSPPVPILLLCVLFFFTSSFCSPQRSRGSYLIKLISSPQIHYGGSICHMKWMPCPR